MSIPFSLPAVRLLTLSLLALICTHAAEPADPFGGAAPSWTEQVAAQKPYRLQIACAETDSPPPMNPAQPNGGANGYLITDEFMKAAKVTTLAVAATDLGKVNREDGIEIVYRLSEKAGTFKVALNVKSKIGGLREINTELGIPEATWQVIGLLTRTEVETDSDGNTGTRRKYYAVAVRIDPTTP
jgi:hypothetical protein